MLRRIVTVHSDTINRLLGEASPATLRRAREASDVYYATVNKYRELVRRYPSAACYGDLER